jgi:long-chain acyl-CoA synthetase
MAHGNPGNPDRHGPHGFTLADIENAQNLVALFLKRADVLGDAPFLFAKADGEWHSLSWAEVSRQVCLLSQSLLQLGLQKGDRVLLVSENRPQWCIADLAIMAAGLITVPAYTTNTVNDHQHVIDNSGARAVIVSGAKLAKNLMPAVVTSNCAEFVIAMEPIRPPQNVIYHDMASLLTGDAELARHAVDARVAGIKREDPACIIYTSGTGGLPRGVRQHHGALLHNAAGAGDVIANDFGWEEERFLSFLPLSHAYEHSAGQGFPIALGAQIFYAEGLDKLAGNIEEVQPTIMVVVPRLFEVLRTRILKQLAKQGKLAETMAMRACKLAERKGNGQSRPLIDHAEDALLERVLRPKARAKFGGRVKALVSGGAPLTPEIGYFFTGLGMPLLQGYGQTESGPIISVNRPRSGLKMDTVGTPLRGVEVRIAEDSEILVRGELVMHGYWRNAEETARALKDGWLHTGDIGHIDRRGRIVITDRKKDMIINDKGDNVAPQRVEGMLTLQPEIGQAMVYGDRKPYLVGLIVPDADWAREWGEAHGRTGDWTGWREDAEFAAAVREAVDRVNNDLSVIEKVRRIMLAEEAFTIENEEMTPSIKIRRHKLRERYGARLEGMYR